MIDIILIFGAGLVIGWNVLPQPKFVKGLWDKLVAVIKKKED